MVLALGYFGKEVRNTWKFSKYGAGEGWNRCWTDRVRNEVLHTVKEEMEYPT
jgi:hypothetical protein